MVYFLSIRKPGTVTNKKDKSSIKPNALNDDIKRLIRYYDHYMLNKLYI